MKRLFALLVLVAFGLSVAQTQTYTVEFKANMKIASKKAKFAPSTDKVVVRGTINNWSGTADELTDPSPKDSVYTLVKTLTRKKDNAADTIFFKYVKVAGTTDSWEDGLSGTGIKDGNRMLVIPAGANKTYTAYLNNDSIYNPTKVIAVKFQVNMEYEIGSGRFVVGRDTASVNGAMNGWSSMKDILVPGTLNTNLYTKSVNITAGVGDKFEYKFWYKPGTWESVDNRKLEITQADYTAGTITIPVVYFNNGTLTTMTNQETSVTFTVNVKGAKAANGTTFTKVQKVYVCGSSKPLNWPGGGWPTADSTLAIKLNDNGTNGDKTAGDQIWSGTYKFPKYTVLTAEYKYGINWGIATDNGGANDNEGSVGGNHKLVLTQFMSAATTVDTFGRGLGKNSALTNVTVVGVEKLAVAPAVYSLNQNYPNPFNPTTNIKFSLPANGMTTLKVYNLLGQEVATLVNENMVAGSYNVDFNASKLSSGIYVYELKSNAFKMTKKMMLVK